MTGVMELHLYEKDGGYLAFELPAELRAAWRPLFEALGSGFLLEGDHCWLHGSLLEAIAELGGKRREVCYFFTLEDPRKRKVGGVGTYSENLPPELGKRLNLAVLTHKNGFPVEKEAGAPVVELDTLFSSRMLSPYSPEGSYWEFECRFGLKAAKFLLLQTAEKVFVHRKDGTVEQVEGLKMKEVKLILNDFQVFLPGILASGLQGVRCAFIWHSVYRPERGSVQDEKRALVEESARALGDRRDVRLLTVSVDDQEFLSRGLKREVALLPNGVPLAEIRARIGDPDLKKVFDTLLRKLDCAERRVLLYVGRYEEYKGIYDLLEAARVLLRTGRFVLIYAFPLPDVARAEEDLRRRAQDRGIPQDIRVLGYLGERELSALMHFSAVLAVPSRREPFGIIVLEGLAHETVVVGTKVGWIPKLLGEAGFLAEPGDAASLASALKWAVMAASDPRAKMERVRRGNKVVEEYTWRKVAEKVMKEIR